MNPSHFYQRNKRFDNPYDDPMTGDKVAKDFDHDEGPGMLSSRAFWGIVLACWCLIGVGVAAWVRWAA